MPRQIKPAHTTASLYLQSLWRYWNTISLAHYSALRLYTWSQMLVYVSLAVLSMHCMKKCVYHISAWIFLSALISTTFGQDHFCKVPKCISWPMENIFKVPKQTQTYSDEFTSIIAGIVYELKISYLEKN